MNQIGGLYRFNKLIKKASEYNLVSIINRTELCNDSNHQNYHEDDLIDLWSEDDDLIDLWSEGMINLSIRLI